MTNKETQTVNFSECIKTRDDGFQMFFAEGIKLSIGIGERHYCNRLPGSVESAAKASATTMEVALMNSMDQFIVLPDDVAGWVPVDRLGEIIQAVRYKKWDKFAKLCTSGESDA